MQNLEIETRVEPEMIRFGTVGNYVFDDMFEFLEFVRSEADLFERKRVLIDSRGLRGQMTEAERFRGGKKIAEIFGSRRKVALIMLADCITKLGELTAVNRGARFLVTDSEAEAIEWLMRP